MPVTIEINGDTMVARLSGELDHHHTQKLREEIDRNVQKERPARLALALCTAFAVVGAVLLAQHYFIGPVYQLPA